MMTIIKKVAMFGLRIGILATSAAYFGLAVYYSWWVGVDKEHSFGLWLAATAASVPATIALVQIDRGKFPWFWIFIVALAAANLLVKV